RGGWASRGGRADRMTRPVPAQPEPARRPPPTEEPEVDESAERWTIDDLAPLRHHERRIR
ncbi:MAG: hypothetical protein AB1Z98_18900, partial [Nannocystaceae bacterium]